ncbi:retinoid-inducible serine carboxypeptidase-like isoform X1 [Microplitis demolitor]|uniref:retinoid-inducible serine carboxypeptidase-like isoform X1 n=1 Tax=Microplitis demolitor TaxID=69319 RepID=UPI0004CCFAFB|nr:retinoid-inducible serine carboxypeptidase-like isoform X1 [Microplitis demolitor]
MKWIWIMTLLSTFLVQVAESSKVGKVGFGPGKQDWGHVTVRPGAQMFWWLYYVNPPTINTLDSFNVFEKPLIIWLQGGPGVSGTGYGNFHEFGPLDLNLKRRNHTWVNDYNVLLIDNPVGVGFSFVENDSLMAKNNTQIAQDLVICIKKFLETIPEFGNVPTYIVGESYGGKMAVEFALLWSQAQNNGNIRSKLKGLAIGDSPISFRKIVRSLPSYLLNMGLIDRIDQRDINRSVNKILISITKEKWVDAFANYKNMWNTIYNVVDNVDVYNILKKTNPTNNSSNNYNFPQVKSPSNPVNISSLIQKLMENDVKKALGLNGTYNLYSNRVSMKLMNDYMKPVTDIVERLLLKTDLKIFVYTGQFDMVVPSPSTLAWMRKLKWNNAKAWRQASRVSFSVNNIIEGFVKEYGNLKLYWINRSGHMVPRDNPIAMKVVLHDLTFDVNEK